MTAPFRVAQHLLRLDDRWAWLKNVARHLKPSGRLGFGVLRPEPSLLSGSHEQAGAIERPIPGSSRTIVRRVRTRPSANTRTVEVNYTWQVKDTDNATVEAWQTTLAFHLPTRSELESLLREQGFEILSYLGSFRRDPFGPDSTDHVILARLHAG